MKISTIFIAFFGLIVTLLACNIPISTINPQTTSPTYTLLPSVTPYPTLPPSPSPTFTPLPENRITNAQSALQNGDWQTALEEFDSILNQNSDKSLKISAQLGQVKTALLEGETDKAINLSLEILNSPDISNYSKEIISELYFLVGQAYANQEKFREAAEAYANYLNHNPGLIDSYIHDLRGDALFSAADFLDAAQAYNAAFQSPGLLDHQFLQMKMARSLALGGDTNASLALYDKIYEETTNDYTKSLIHLRKGQIYQSLDKNEQAQQEYLSTVSNFPTSYESYTALLNLVDAEIKVNELDRGLVDFFAEEYGVALAAFDRYLNSAPSDPGTALYYSGLAHQKGGRYEQAINSWEKVIQNYPDHPYWDDAWEQKGFTQWYYQGDYTSAVETFTSFTSLNPLHERAAEFLDNASRVAERSGDLERAATLWKSVTMQYPNDPRSVYTLFLAGISQYRLGKYEEALANFNGSLGISLSLSDKSRAYLWIGKTHKQLGNTEEADKAWKNGALVDPTGYYSERSRDLLLNRPPFTPPGMVDFGTDYESEKIQAEAWMMNTFKLPENVDLSSMNEFVDEPAMQRANELWRLGLIDEARLEYEALREAVTFDPVLTFKLARYYNEIGLYRSAAFAARHVLDLAGHDDASSLTAPTFFNKIRFPIHFSEIIIPTATDFQIHPLLILSLIRQESLFESFVQSSASARGLMQIIPSTGTEVAEKIGWPKNFKPQDLNRPVVNIRLGITYLAEQLERFDGDIFSALAAYNGGPGNASQWLALAQDDQDLFLEVIRYSETREYIRRIYEIFSIYRRLYDRTP